MLGLWFQHISINFVILHAQNACQVSNVHANPEKNFCSLRSQNFFNCVLRTQGQRAAHAGSTLRVLEVYPHRTAWDPVWVNAVLLGDCTHVYAITCHKNGARGIWFVS